MLISCTILLLDDEPLILMDLEFASEERGCTALGAMSLAQAFGHLETHELSCAVLDVTLKDGETCIPIANELQQRGIPYILHSGDLDRQNEMVRQLDATLIAKPANSDMVIDTAMTLSCP
ncbi:response regulator [Erythrobacter jejuensis]|uniref:Response regulator n=1 Tax=Parerythrobacter jejuensis TaxID=795812 RepID=A0A845AV59_9SPHN|nr:response regulator [Parerythrobacter jejuensis]MXP33073.1 response regulator [Parerythrobacter jejuensis]